jgi:hypothetical protein
MAVGEFRALGLCGIDTETSRVGLQIAIQTLATWLTYASRAWWG